MDASPRQINVIEGRRPWVESNRFYGVEQSDLGLTKSTPIHWIQFGEDFGETLKRTSKILSPGKNMKQTLTIDISLILNSERSWVETVLYPLRRILFSVVFLIVSVLSPHPFDVPHELYKLGVRRSKRSGYPVFLRVRTYSINST